MTWHDDLLVAMANYLRRAGKDVVEVTDYDEHAWEMGGCPTCGGWQEYGVELEYLDSAGKKLYHEVKDIKFTEFVRQLTD